MSADEQIARAERLSEDYLAHLVGSLGHHSRSLYQRHAATDVEESFEGIEGPFLQALDIPRWSERAWESYGEAEGLDPRIIDTFATIGFEQLYEFQEEAITAIRRGEDALVKAATGRGKTEAWLIPILDDIVQRRTDVEQSNEHVKAVLIYPTKALAQDQFKRIIDYLFLINKDLPPRKQITVGIYDGDTPRDRSEHAAEGYLRTTFKFMDCPGYSPDLSKCQDCGRGVKVINRGDTFEASPEKSKCREDVPLGFVKLTKQDIIDQGVDIILTNPDTINVRAVNVNGGQERQRLIHEPEYVVFDEIHTYDGQFGSYTSMLMRRIRAMRDLSDTGTFPQMIASSATVRNGRELFEKVTGSAQMTEIAERTEAITDELPTRIPRWLYAAVLSPEELHEQARITGEIGDDPDHIPVPVEQRDNLSEAEYRSQFRRQLFDQLVRGDERGDATKTIMGLYRLLRRDPVDVETLREKLQRRTDLESADLRRLLANFQVIGQEAGLLENRVHLFSWPLDGFFSCVTCDVLYREPRGRCTMCDGDFITRTTYCSRCREESLLAWYCGGCDQMHPYQPLGGEAIEAENRVCPGCNDQIMQRVTFRPHLKCESCGAERVRSSKSQCAECGSLTAATGESTVRCVNPECEETGDLAVSCNECGSRDSEAMVRAGSSTCGGCGREHDLKDGRRTRCECGTPVSNRRFCPWVCRNDECEIRIWEQEPPERCPCGTRIFTLEGIFEVFGTMVCPHCGEEGVGTTPCDCEVEAEERLQTSPSNYELIEASGRLRAMSDSRTAQPCYHPHQSSSVRGRGSKYDQLRRSPANIAVTTAQYLLRDVASADGLARAKMLAFSDSHREMNELDQDFQDPEVETFQDQLIIDPIRTEGGWWDVPALVERADERLRAYEARLSTLTELPDESVDLMAKIRVGYRDTLEDLVLRRIVPHAYGAVPGRPPTALSSEGIVDVRMKGIEELTSASRSVLAAIIEDGVGQPEDSILEDSSESVIEGFNQLVEDGLLTVTGGRVWIDPARVEVALAGEGDGIWFDPTTGDHYPSVYEQVHDLPDQAVRFDTPYEELADPTHPRYRYRAFRAQGVEPMLLLSRIYYGLTNKRDRREIEYRFKEGKYPNFLSTGPTMEVGVDIGDLDYLLLYGTPPNTNAYLQRVGRAGRRSKTGVIHSVSKRNPIDYYYYQTPGELIASSPKDVPLNDLNEEVLEVSLSWAIFDYMAERFTVNWQVKRSGRRTRVRGGDDYQLESDAPADFSKFTHLWPVRAETLRLNSRDHNKLRGLAMIVDDHKDAIREHLETVLAFRFCDGCGRRPTAASEDRCEVCGEPYVSGSTHYASRIDSALEQFRSRYIEGFYREYDRIEGEKRTIATEIDELRREQREADDETFDAIGRTIEDLETHDQILTDRLGEILGLTLMDVHGQIGEQKFDFGMRSVDERVGIVLQTEDGRERLDDNYGGRALKMAIGELHPSALYKRDKRRYVVTSVSTDDYASHQLRKAIDRAIVPSELQEVGCMNCGFSADAELWSCPECGSELKQIDPRVMTRVEAVDAELQMSYRNETPVTDLLSEGGKRVRSTYARPESSVISFQADETYILMDGAGGRLGTIEWGPMEVFVYAAGYKRKFMDGSVDPSQNRFEMCGVEGCDGVVYRTAEAAGCTQSKAHDPDDPDAPSTIAYMGMLLETAGVRVDLDDHIAAHTLAHGLRVGLQYLAGVDIRMVGESVGSDDSVYVFDDQQGGAAVTEMLFRRDAEGTLGIEEALDLIYDHFDCPCDGGCPNCVYQRGCDVRDYVSELDPAVVRQWWTDGSPHLEGDVGQGPRSGS